jgi:hypothetical protein
MVQYYIEKLVVGVDDVRGSHDEVARVHVLEEVDSVRAVVQIAVHLGQFSWGDDPHLLILFVFYDDFLWFLPQTCGCGPHPFA